MKLRAASWRPLLLSLTVCCYATWGCAGSDSPAPGGSAGQAPVGGTASAAGTGSAAGSTAAGGSGGGVPSAGSGSGGVPSAGAAGTAGASGSTSAGGSTAGGSSGNGSGGSAGAGGRPSGPSAGCSLPPSQDEPQKAIVHPLMVSNIADKYKPAYVTRKFYTTLPRDFDPTKPYPMIFYGQGCGQVNEQGGPFSGGHFAKDAMYVQLIPAVVDNQTVVPSNGAPGCFQAGKQGFADSPDGPYFDMVLAEIAKSYCVDLGKVYVAGWSSGAWLSNYLACTRGNVIAGTAAGSGGLQYDHGTCTGGAKVMLLPGDAGSITEASHPIGAETARDTFILSNEAGTPMAKQLGSASCQVYPGKGDVAWCPVGGDHGAPLGPIADAAWEFWTGQAPP